jgi:hypothetical protein
MFVKNETHKLAAFQIDFICPISRIYGRQGNGTLHHHRNFLIQAFFFFPEQKNKIKVKSSISFSVLSIS